MNKAVFLDRDGVINRAIVRDGKPYPPVALNELEILPGVYEALAVLKKANYKLIVVTNQPDVARGLVGKKVVDAMNKHLAEVLPIDDVFTCFHDDHEACHCRKPAPGALLAAAAKYGIDLAPSYMVGDRWRDIEAGQRAGCKTVFIDYGYSEKQPEHVDSRVRSLREAALVILGEKQ
jgi:D-glycero-D-manno-heptose 1,7-bisphosphate phosphatase